MAEIQEKERAYAERDEQKANVEVTKDEIKLAQEAMEETFGVKPTLDDDEPDKAVTSEQDMSDDDGDSGLDKESKLDDDKDVSADFENVAVADPHQKPAGETVDADDKEKTGEVELPEAYVRAAVHQGWTEKDVKEFFEAEPDKALKTFGNIYQSTLRISEVFSQAGRAAKKSSEEPVKVATDTKSTSVGLTPEQLKKIEDEYANDPIVSILKTQDAAIKNYDSRLRQIESRPAVEVKDDVVAVMTEIDAFFTSKEIEPYKEFYGSVPKGKQWQDSLMPGEHANRLAVAELADAIASGAMLQGRKMGVAEALTLAHLSITDKVRDRIVVNRIKSKVVNREKGLTIKPRGSSKANSNDGKPKNEAELVGMVGEALRATFGN